MLQSEHDIELELELFVGNESERGSKNKEVEMLYYKLQMND